MNFANMPSSHFIFIPAVLLIGVVIGWVLGSRAARDVCGDSGAKERASRGGRAAGPQAAGHS